LKRDAQPPLHRAGRRGITGKSSISLTGESGAALAPRSRGSIHEKAATDARSEGSMSKEKTVKQTNNSSVVLLRDLAPRKGVAGGNGKVLFGERQECADDAPKQGKQGRL